VSRDAEPPGFEDRWKEPQHGNVNNDERYALVIVSQTIRWCRDGIMDK